MTALWQRVGVFRALATFLLALGMVGGAFAGIAQEPRRAEASGRTASPSTNDHDELRAAAAEQHRTEAASRSAQRKAQEKADAAASAAVVQAKAADAKSASPAAKPPAAKPAPPYPVPASCKQYSGNRATGCAILLERGFGLDQMPCLDKLWTKESGWNHRAYNSGSGATGIPQALPGSKMASAGSDWQTNPATQIKWGLGYIKGRYGTPCKAWQHSQATGWY